MHRGVRRLAWMLLSPAFVGCVGGPKAGPPMTADERAVMVRSFDEMWTTVRDRHYDPGLGGVDWEAVRAEFRPKVEAAGTRDEAVALMNGALSRLGQSHFQVISADAYEGMTQPSDDPSGGVASGTDGDVGLDVRAAGGEIVVVRVEPGSPAERAGIRPGWRIVESNGRTTESLTKAIEKAYPGGHKGAFMASMAARARVKGDAGSTLRLVTLDGAGRRRSHRLECAAPAGTPVVFGNLPTIYVAKESRRLASGAGYLRLSAFFDPPAVMPWFRATIAEFRDAPGIIIDIRGNPGGIGGMSMGMGNMLVSAPNLKLGTMTTRETTISFVLNPQPGRYDGPVAVLVDECSASTSEFLAGGLQAIGRARIFGVRTAGMALPSVVVKLPSGDGFQYVTANYVAADGRVLEGAGVIPDETVPVDPAALEAGRDPVIEAAEAWIRGSENRPEA